MNVATVFGINIESVSPPDDAVFGVVSGGPGPAHSSPARSYGLQLRRQRSGEALEIEDPADQVRFLADPGEPTPAEATQTVPVFALAEEFLDLFPTALRQSVPDAQHAHVHPRMGPPAVAGVHGDVARMTGVQVEVVKGDPRRAVDPVALAQRRVADTAREIKAILVVQIDTASGVVNDLAAIHHAIASVGHPALLMVDCVASLGCIAFEMDEWGVDVAMAGSQKGLMTGWRRRLPGSRLCRHKARVRLPCPG